MIKLIGLLTLSFIIISACSKKPDIVTLEEGSPAYQLGKELATTVSAMDPDSNRVLITAKYFHISTGEVLQLMSSYMGNQTEALKKLDKENLLPFVQQTAMQLAEKKLLLNAVHKAKIEVSSSEIDSILNKQYQQFGGEVKFIESLQVNGLDLEVVKQDIRDRILIERYFNNIIQKESRITEKEIQKAYQQFLQDTVATVQHILLVTEEKTDEEKEKIQNKIAAILKRAKKGEAFEELAREFSEDPASKENGGLYENFSRGVMVKSFEDAAFSVPIGEISDIVETQYGYHILKVIDRKKNNASFNEVRPELEEQLLGPERREIIPSHIAELKEEANLQVIPF